VIAIYDKSFKTNEIAEILTTLCIGLRAPFWLPIAATVAGHWFQLCSLMFYKQLELRGEL
jgi:hypothetical protein